MATGGSGLPRCLPLLQMKLLELQELVMRLVSERNEWYTKYMTVAQNLEPKPGPGSEAAVTLERRLELDATDGEGEPAVSLLKLLLTDCNMFFLELGSSSHNPWKQEIDCTLHL